MLPPWHALHLLLPPHSLHLTRRRPCSHISLPPHEMHLERTRPCSQMLRPPHFLHTLRRPPCWHSPFASPVLVRPPALCPQPPAVACCPLIKKEGHVALAGRLGRVCSDGSCHAWPSPAVSTLQARTDRRGRRRGRSTRACRSYPDFMPFASGRGLAICERREGGS